jgi:NAD/NADP transhydrogenase alpha subunit
MSMFNLFLMAVVFIGSFAIAITTATFNVVGGFAITDRMLRLFKGKKKIS